MACGCGRGRAAKGYATGGTRPAPLGYSVVLPTGESHQVLTALEAKRLIRRHGGGTVRVLTAEAAPPVATVSP